MKIIIDDTRVDIHTVCVDSQKVKDALLNDDIYEITEVPSLLLITSAASDGQSQEGSQNHKVLTSGNLDVWFQQLIENIRTMNQPQPAEVETTPFTQFESAPDPEPETGLKFVSSRTPPKRMGNDAREASDETFRSNGRDEQTEITSFGDEEETGQPRPSVASSAIKKENTISPSELAKLMMSQRDKIEEEIEATRV